MCSNMMLTTCRATCSNIIYSKPRQTCKGLECFGSTTPTNFSKEAFSKGPEDLCIAQSPKHCQADDLRLDALDASLEMFIRAILNGIFSYFFFILCTLYDLYVSCLLRFGMSWFLHPGLCVCGLTNDKITSTLLILGYIYICEYIYDNVTATWCFLSLFDPVIFAAHLLFEQADLVRGQQTLPSASPPWSCLGPGTRG